MKSKENIDSPQDKAHLVKDLIPVLSEIKNSIILNEYIHLVAEKLELKEETLSREVKKLLQKNSPVKRAFQPILKKKTEKHVLAQKNLLSLYFINSEKVPLLCINDYLKEAKFTDTNYLLVKQQIAEIINESDEMINSEELNKRLFVDLADKEEIKQLLVDINFSLDDKKDLDEKSLRLYIKENISCINRYLEQSERELLKSSYHAAKDDEISALQLQYKVRELVKLGSNRLEIINEQEDKEDR